MNIRRPVESDALACYATFVGAVLSTPKEISSDDDKRVWIDRLSVEMLEERLKTAECWIAEDDGLIAGFCAFIPALTELKSLYVHPEFQGRGVGALLMGACMERARELGIPQISLESSANAIQFYEKFGFVDLKQPCCHLPSGIGTRMCLELS